MKRSLAGGSVVNNPNVPDRLSNRALPTRIPTRSALLFLLFIFIFVIVPVRTRKKKKKKTKEKKKKTPQKGEDFCLDEPQS